MFYRIGYKVDKAFFATINQGFVTHFSRHLGRMMVSGDTLDNLGLGNPIFFKQARQPANFNVNLKAVGTVEQYLSNVTISNAVTNSLELGDAMSPSLEHTRTMLNDKTSFFQLF